MIKLSNYVKMKLSQNEMPFFFQIILCFVLGLDDELLLS